MHACDLLGPSNPTLALVAPSVRYTLGLQSGRSTTIHIESDEWQDDITWTVWSASADQEIVAIVNETMGDFQLLVSDPSLLSLKPRIWTERPSDAAGGAEIAEFHFGWPMRALASGPRRRWKRSPHSSTARAPRPHSVPLPQKQSRRVVGDLTIPNPFHSSSSPSTRLSLPTIILPLASPSTPSSSSDPTSRGALNRLPRSVASPPPPSRPLAPSLRLRPQRPRAPNPSAPSAASQPDYLQVTPPQALATNLPNTVQISLQNPNCMVHSPLIHKGDQPCKPPPPTTTLRPSPTSPAAQFSEGLKLPRNWTSKDPLPEPHETIYQNRLRGLVRPTAVSPDTEDALFPASLMPPSPSRISPASTTSASSRPHRLVRPPRCPRLASMPHPRVRPVPRGNPGAAEPHHRRHPRPGAVLPVPRTRSDPRPQRQPAQRRHQSPPQRSCPQSRRPPPPTVQPTQRPPRSQS